MALNAFDLVSLFLLYSRTWERATRSCDSQNHVTRKLPPLILSLQIEIKSRDLKPRILEFINGKKEKMRGRG